MTRRHDLVAKDWIRSVREELKLSQDDFGEKIGAPGGRDTVAKWEGGARKEPGFTYTRRMVVVAPPELVRVFVGRSADSLAMSDPDRMVRASNKPGAYEVKTTEGMLVARQLDGIGDDTLRTETLRKCLNLIAEAQNPSELGADKRPDRAQRK